MNCGDSTDLAPESLPASVAYDPPIRKGRNGDSHLSRITAGPTAKFSPRYSTTYCLIEPLPLSFAAAKNLGVLGDLGGSILLAPLRGQLHVLHVSVSKTRRGEVKTRSAKNRGGILTTNSLEHHLYKSIVTKGPLAHSRQQLAANGRALSALWLSTLDARLSTHQ